jgi:hypothetical protein
MWKILETFDSAVGCQKALEEAKNKWFLQVNEYRRTHPGASDEEAFKAVPGKVVSAQCISRGDVQHLNSDGEYAIQRATCRGWVWHPGESIGGAGICYGEYARALNIIRYRVDRSSQRVWVHDEGTDLQPQDGWSSFLTPGRMDVTGSCRVFDARNWSCSVRDRYGSDETEMVGGVEHLRVLGGTAPDDFSDLFMYMARCDVQIGAGIRPLEEAEFLIKTKTPLIDCRKRPA